MVGAFAGILATSILLAAIILCRDSNRRNRFCWQENHPSAAAGASSPSAPFGAR
jgi:hypothetical protein